MQKSMGEHVSDTVSNLLPLLGLLFGIFAVIILAAVFLRFRVRQSAGGGPRRQRVSSPAEMRPGDVVNVLGKTFHVIDNASLSTDAGAAAWCGLSQDEGPARLLLMKDMSIALYFPGHGDAPEGESFPGDIDREEGGYKRQEEPVLLAEGWKLARYLGPGERWLAVEARDDRTTLWRGKIIPVEGVTMIED